MTLRSSAACGTVRSAMPRPCIPCWVISTDTAGCAVRLRSFSEKKNHRAALPKGTRNYAWTLFRPDGQALSELAQLVAQRRLSLPIGICKPLGEAAEAFDHVRKGRPGRALLIPEH